jgi:hypothetical protein
MSAESLLAVRRAAALGHQYRGPCTHTPGPWRVLGGAIADKATDFAIGINGENGKRHIIAEAFGRSDWQHAHPSEANARLISAAPDMLAALQALDLTCSFDVLNACWNNRPLDVPGKHYWGVGAACPQCTARAAIAKAMQS